MSVRIGELFAGYGGLGMGVVAAIPNTSLAWVSEFDAAPARILAHHWPDVTNHGDVTAIDWTAVERPDVLTGGFPCQDVSVAGRRAGMVEGTRSGLWSYMAHAIDVLRPQLVVIENVGGLLSAEAGRVMEPHPVCLGDAGAGVESVPVRALPAVLADLSALGYDAQWTTLRAADVGAPHGRLRVFITAHPTGHPFAPHPGGGGSGRRSPVTVTGGAGAQDVAPVRADSRPHAPGAPAGLTLLPTPRTTDMNGGGAHGTGGPDLRTAIQDAVGHPDFGPYAPAIARWERVLGRPAPAPTEINPNKRKRCTVHANPTEAGSREELRDMRGAADSEAVRERTTRRPECVSTETALLPLMREHESGGEEGDASLAGPTAPEGDVRGVRSHERSARPSSRPESREQQLDESRNAVRELPSQEALARGPREATSGEPVGDPCTCGRPRLSARFVEFLMGLPDGHVTGVPGLTRNQQLKALGNGVVPQQAAAAIHHLTTTPGDQP